MDKQRTEKVVDKLAAVECDSRLYSVLAESIEEGLLLCKKKKREIICVNRKARDYLQLEDNVSNLEEILEESKIAELLAGNVIYENITGTPVKLCYQSADGYFWVIISEYVRAESQLESLKQAVAVSCAMMGLFESTDDEDVVICDGEGTLEYVGALCASIDNAPKRHYIGMNVFDLEREKIFYPSSLARAIDKRGDVVLMQTTKDGDQFVAIAIPLFADNGEIEKVVSISRKYSSYMQRGRAALILSQLKQNFENGRVDTEEVGDEEDDIVTCNENMLAIKRLARLIANTNSTVLITGETGSGKEMMARYIYNRSNRRQAPFISVNCGTISHNIVESELFGYEPGSFTGASREGKTGLIEAANGGVLFLDEIGELPLEQQVKLLHVLQEKTLIKVGGTKSVKLDIRVIAATNRDLAEEVKRGTFREDLYYRLNVVPIKIPALRHRKRDISILAKFFLKKFGEYYGSHKQMTRNALECMSKYEWPGNIRQLENIMEYLVITTSEPFIDREALPVEIREGALGQAEDDGIMVTKLMPISTAIAQVEKQLICMALKDYHTVTKVAEVLGVNQSTISRKVVQYNIRV